MALVNCPVCNKRNSDKAQECRYCGVSFSGDSASLERWRRIERIKKQASLTTHGFAAVTLVVAAMTLYFWGGDKPSSGEQISAFTMGIVGALWYVISRIRLFLHKRENK
ncbi:zinc ribbon domain-containing protein [Paraferrimonas sp. SM1919]|uniref:zinc ribbon domain-containing protein n=1 Tax=Paraferrimonas sp. SM1919 TaxID=2662263 RepID=UPI0013D4BA08|nr:zinc ribbon domain-containing protein [Paraferrimonas sp. SM1919]